MLARGQGEKGPCDHELFFLAPLALPICGAGSSGGSGDSLPAPLCVPGSGSACLCVLVSLSLCTLSPSVFHVSCVSISFSVCPLTSEGGRTNSPGPLLYPIPSLCVYTALCLQWGQGSLQLNSWTSWKGLEAKCVCPYLVSLCPPLR